MPTLIDQAIEDFWQERQRGVHFPPQWLERLTLEDSYHVQLGLLARLVAQGARQVGWKVGLTSRAIQEQFQVHEPVFGYLLDSAPNPSGTRFTHAELIQPGFENEICVTLGEGLAGPGVDDAQALRAVASVRPAMELVETRGDFTQYLAVALADNAQQKAVVLGPELRPLPPSLDLAEVRAKVFINGEQVAEGRGDAVLGHPIRSVRWLANALVQYGRTLEPGDLIMTGSLTRQFPIAAGDTIWADFDPLGRVTATFLRS